MRTLLALTVLWTVPAATISAAATGPLFTDAAAETGLDFVHWNGMTGELYFTEMTGQGGALVDYDGDGDLDVYLVQGAHQDDKEPLEPFPGAGPPRDRLFRNDLVRGEDGRLVPRFVDVTDRAGLLATGYGMGVATGDVDNDGDVDVYVTNYGSNQLWQNRGDGTFEDATAQSGADDKRWSTSAAFFDYDADGWLDLYVANYVVYSVEENVVCYAPSSRHDYCGPSSFQGVGDKLLHNRGDGTFEDVTTQVLQGYAPGPGLGVVAGDWNADGRLDLYVANDGAANQLWLQRDDGVFVDEALFSGTAVNRAGQPEASMGVDSGDLDGDGDPDLVLAHLMGETNTVYLNDGQALFTDRSAETGLGSPSFTFTSFGTGLFDVDNDGWLDLLTLSGAVTILESLALAGDPYPLDQPNQLYRNTGGGRFEDVTAEAGPVFALAEVSRGAAFGDVDQDGDVDVLVTNNNGPVRLLRNEVGSEHHWLGLRLVAGGRDQLGATVELERDALPRLVRRVRTDGSYCSAHDPRVLFGLGSEPGFRSARVVWPGGRTETWRGLPVDTYLTLFREQ